MDNKKTIKINKNDKKNEVKTKKIVKKDVKVKKISAKVIKTKSNSSKKKKFVFWLVASFVFVLFGAGLGAFVYFNTEYDVLLKNTNGLIFDFNEDEKVKIGKDFSFSFDMEEDIIEYTSFSKVVVNGQVVIPENDIYTVKNVKNDLIIETFGFGTSGLTLNNLTLNQGVNKANVVIPNGVQEIFNGSFSTYANVVNVFIPSSVRMIKDAAFNGCSKLENIYITDSLTEIYINAFQGTKFITNHADGVVYIGSTVYSYKGVMSAGTKVKILEGTKSIAQSAFSGQTNLVEVETPESLKIILSNAFLNCSSLYKVNITDNIEKISSNVFLNTLWYNNSSNGFLYLGNWLVAYKGIFNNTTVVLKEGTIGIAGYSFPQNNSLTSLILPEGIKYISDYAFINCYAMQELVLPESLLIIFDYAFTQCGLINLIIPKNVVSLGVSIFNNCMFLESVTIKCDLDTLENIFYMAAELENVILEGEVKNIKSNILYFAPSIVNFTLHFNNPPKIIGSDFLSGYANPLFKIYVPLQALNTYKAAEGWNVKADYIFAMES